MLSAKKVMLEMDTLKYSYFSNDIYKRWTNGDCYYCAFYDGSVVEYDARHDPKRLIVVDYYHLEDDVLKFRTGELHFDQFDNVDYF